MERRKNETVSPHAKDVYYIAIFFETITIYFVQGIRRFQRNCFSILQFLFGMEIQSIF